MLLYYSGDTVIYREISADEDHHTLQADLNTLVQWEREFSMEFHHGFILKMQHSASITIHRPTTLLLGLQRCYLAYF